MASGNPNLGSILVHCVWIVYITKTFISTVLCIHNVILESESFTNSVKTCIFKQLGNETKLRPEVVTCTWTMKLWSL